MRAKNYDNQAASFTPLEPQHMVRVALVEGMKPEYSSPERQRYRRLLKDYSGADPSRIDILFRLMQTGPRSQRESGLLDALVNEVAYDSGTWRRFGYDALKDEGVIIKHDGNLKGLARLVQEIDENKVIFVPAIGERAIDPDDEPDYLKHVDWRSKLVLNGPDVVRRFAQDRGFELPDNYLDNGRMTVPVLELLEQNGFYFTEALKTGIEVLKEPKYQDRVVTAMAIRRRDGTELRLHPHDFVEAAEFYTHLRIQAQKQNRDPNQIIRETLGDRLTLTGSKYNGVNTFKVPKRRPIGRNSYNKVELHYFPDPRADSEHPLEWMDTRVSCDCPHALNMRNFETRHGKMTRVVETMDTHANMVFLDEMRAKEISTGKAVNNMSPIPTLPFSDFVDKLRYNIVQEFEVDRLSGKIRRTYVWEIGMEKIIHELAKDPEWTFGRMFNPSEKTGRRLLKPMYI